MTNLEKLDRVARDIFWVRQKPKWRKQARKVAAWESLTAEAREGWRDIARNLILIVHALPADSLALAQAMKGKSP